MNLKRTALYDIHRRSEARMGEFGGWEMPISYPLGTIGEHMAVRRGAAVFDVSHLGTVQVTGPDAFESIQRTLTNDLTKISPGRAQYTHLLDSDTGGVTDDLIVWWTDKSEFDVMPNASNTSRVVEALAGHDVTSERAIIALQGPTYGAVLERVLPSASRVTHFQVMNTTYKNHSVKVAGTGYTGEKGVEIYCINEIAPQLWEDLVDAGATEAGLGARDTLRLEAGLPLHGHELGPDISPLRARLDWVVSFSKSGFIGREALLKEKAAGIKDRLIGIRGLGRQPLRQGQIVTCDGSEIGVITSGSYSPVLGKGIGLGFVQVQVEVGQSVAVEGRNRSIEAEISALPFVAKAYAS